MLHSLFVIIFIFQTLSMGTLGSFVSAKISQLEKAPMIHQVDQYVRLTRNVTLAPMKIHKTVAIATIPVLSKH